MSGADLHSPATDRSAGRMTTDEAIQVLRSDPEKEALVRDAYLGADVGESANRFFASAEFAEARRLFGPKLQGAVATDIGAGAGIGAYALVRAGASKVYAIEPDASDAVGRGAMKRLRNETAIPIDIIEGWGEALPLPDASVDLAYARQVLHHAADLEMFLSEIGRVLRPGGVLLACREHVVDDERQKELFLAAHPVHQLAGGENAYSLSEYLAAIEEGGLVVNSVLGPWDSVINAFPAVRSNRELETYPARALEGRFGVLGRLAARVPGVAPLTWWRVRRPIPGRMYTFLCAKGPAIVQR